MRIPFMKIIKIKFQLMYFIVLYLFSCSKDNTTDVITPITLVTTPANGAIDVRYDTIVVIKATFNVDVVAATVTNLTFKIKSSNGSALVGTVSYSNKVATFTSDNFQPFTTYTATITTGVASSVAKLSANVEWSFRTANTTSVTPTITSFEPLSGFDGDTIRVKGANFLDPIFSFNGKVAKIVYGDSKDRTIIVPEGTTTSVLNVRVGTKNATSAEAFKVIEPKTEIALITKALIGKWINVLTRIRSYKGDMRLYYIDLSKGFDVNSDKFFDSLLYSKTSLESLEISLISDTLRAKKYFRYKGEEVQQKYDVYVVLNKKRNVLNSLTPHSFSIIEKSGSTVSTVYETYNLTGSNMSSFLSNIIVEKTFQPTFYYVYFKKL